MDERLAGMTRLLVQSGMAIAEFYENAVPEITNAIGEISARPDQPGHQVALRDDIHDQFESASFGLPDDVNSIVGRYYDNIFMGGNAYAYGCRALHMAAQRLDPSHEVPYMFAKHLDGMVNSSNTNRRFVASNENLGVEAANSDTETSSMPEEVANLSSSDKKSLYYHLVLLAGGTTGVDKERGFRQSGAVAGFGALEQFYQRVPQAAIDDGTIWSVKGVHYNFEEDFCSPVASTRELFAMDINAPEDQKISLTDKGRDALAALEPMFKDVQDFGTVNGCLAKIWDSLNRDLEKGGYDRIPHPDSPLITNIPGIEGYEQPQGSSRRPRVAGAHSAPGAG